MDDFKKDVFICHASEDKQGIAIPLQRECEKAGISCWLDNEEIQWGDSITEKVNNGLSISRYVVVILSSSFVGKPWPRRELFAETNKEASTGGVRVLPLLVGSQIEKQQILGQLSLLNDKFYLSWEDGVEQIVHKLLSRLQKGDHNPPIKNIVSQAVPRYPLPNIKRQFTQRDKDLFLRSGFNYIKDYFKEAIKELEKHIQGAESDFEEITASKFMATLYINGNRSKRCKIWLGGLGSDSSIAYYDATDVSVDHDNSMNDWLSVTENGQSLGFAPSGMWFGNQPKDPLSEDKAAEYLWRRFIQNIQ